MKLQETWPGSAKAMNMKSIKTMPAALPSERPRPESPATRLGGAMVGSSALWNTAENSNDTLAMATLAPQATSSHPEASGFANHMVSIAMAMMMV